MAGLRSIVPRHGDASASRCRLQSAAVSYSLLTGPRRSRHVLRSGYDRQHHRPWCSVGTGASGSEVLAIVFCSRQSMPACSCSIMQAIILLVSCVCQSMTACSCSVVHLTCEHNVRDSVMCDTCRAHLHVHACHRQFNQACVPSPASPYMSTMASDQYAT